MNNGYFIVADLEGALREQIADVQRRFDPKLAASSPPHVTLVGSSGVGPIPLDTPVERIRGAVEPIVARTHPLTLAFHAPVRFMQSDVVVMPLDPHGRLRELHDEIARSGLPFARARFPFTPHATLSFFPSLSRDVERQLLAIRATAPLQLTRLRLYRSIKPMPYQFIDEFVLGAGLVPAGGSDE